MATPVVRVYSDGVFDLFHHGHGRVLEQAKKAFPNVHLVTGVHDDATVHASKGMTVMTYHERLQAVRHCRWVDEVMEDAPWKIDEQFIAKHRIDFVAHDGAPYPWPGTNDADLYDVPKRMGIFIPMERTPGISTSDLIQRVLDERVAYTARNHDRTNHLTNAAR